MNTTQATAPTTAQPATRKPAAKKVYPPRPLEERRIMVYDLSTNAGKWAIHREAREGGWNALWMNWQDNRVPRDLGAIAWIMVGLDFRHFRMQVLAQEPDENGERPAHDATKRELVVIRRELLNGYLDGLTAGFARFLAHNNYVVPRIVSNRFAGWR